MKSNPVTMARLFLVGIAMVIYGWLAYHTAGQNGPSLAGATLGFAPLAGFAVWLAWKSRWRNMLFALLTATGLIVWFNTDWLLLHYHWAYLIQHAGAMILFGAMFGRTLLPGREALVTRFAHMVHESMSPRLIAYTRKVTWAWTLFFILMALASFALFFLAPLQDWALFANGATPIMVVAMFVIEYLVRVVVLPAGERVGPIQGILAYTRYCAQTAGSVRANESKLDGGKPH